MLVLTCQVQLLDCNYLLTVHTDIPYNGIYDCNCIDFVSKSRKDTGCILCVYCGEIYRGDIKYTINVSLDNVVMYSGNLVDPNKKRNADALFKFLTYANHKKKVFLQYADATKNSVVVVIEYGELYGEPIAVTIPLKNMNQLACVTKPLKTIDHPTCTVKLRNIDYLVYTEQKKDINGTLSPIIVAYDKKHDLYYKHEILPYRNEFYEPDKLLEYIDTQIALNNITLYDEFNNIQYVNVSIKYGTICGKPLIYMRDLCCTREAEKVINGTE